MLRREFSSSVGNFTCAKTRGLIHEHFNHLWNRSARGREFPAGNRHWLINYQELFQGSIDGTSVHPREVVKEAPKQNAAAVILATHIRAQ